MAWSFSARGWLTRSFENSKARGSNFAIELQGNSAYVLILTSFMAWSFSARWWLTRSFENSKAGGSNSSIGGGPINQENFPEKLSITLHIYVSKHASRHKLMDLEKLLMESQSSPVNRF